MAGTLTIRDADTIVVDGTPVRLNGVDAPELKTSAGESAKRWMINLDCPRMGLLQLRSRATAWNPSTQRVTFYFTAGTGMKGCPMM